MVGVGEYIGLRLLLTAGLTLTFISVYKTYSNIFVKANFLLAHPPLLNLQGAQGAGGLVGPLGEDSSAAPS